MKKVFTMLCVLALLLMCFGALAADEHPEPVLFRGVAWGATYSEVAKVLPKGVKMRDLQIREYYYPMADMMYDESGWGNQIKAEIGCYTYATSSSLKGVKVAGYDVADLCLYFIFKPDENGKIIKDEKHTAFYYGYYKLEPKDPDAVYNDLISKLTKLYGDVDDQKSSTSIISDNMSLWNGANGTMVSVYKQDYSSGSHYIYIKYGFSGGDDLMQEAYAAVVREESEAAVSDMDGL